MWLALVNSISGVLVSKSIKFHTGSYQIWEQECEDSIYIKAAVLF